MSELVLIVLVGGAFALQLALDVRSIRAAVHRYGWSAPRVRWAPWRQLLRSRWERAYWLWYRDDRGRTHRRLCRITSFLDGNAPVELEIAATLGEHAASGARAASRTGRVGFLVLSTLAGVVAGTALGIGGALVLYPGSNIAPAYGILWMAPLGLAAGAAYGALGRRAREAAHDAVGDARR